MDVRSFEVSSRTVRKISMMFDKMFLHFTHFGSCPQGCASYTIFQYHFHTLLQILIENCPENEKFSQLENDWPFNFISSHRTPTVSQGGLKTFFSNHVLDNFQNLLVRIARLENFSSILG